MIFIPPKGENMEKLSRIQKRNNLNEVFRLGEVGPGGAHHTYDVRTVGTDDRVCLIEFQKGPRVSAESKNGVLDSDLLEIVRDRLTAFQEGEFACRENEKALVHIIDALLWMNKRVEDRAERGVLGTTSK